MPVLPPSVLSQDATSFIRLRMAKCVEQCGHTIPEELSSLPSRLIRIEHDWIRLIEVGDISHSGQHVPFSTLSYCWGDVPHLKLGKDTLKHMQDGISINDLAAAHRDAIILTRALSIPYIWIDALCIFQDDMDDWARESENMRSVYASSELTICATTSASSNEGFLNRTWQRVTIPFKNSTDDEKTETHGIQVLAYGFSEFDLQDLGAWDERPHRASLWSTRSWTFQKETFSRRRLYFTSMGLIFSCSNFWYIAAARTKRSPRLSLFDQMPTVLDPNDLYCLRGNVISIYARRGITKVSDDLPALSGFAREFSRLLQDDYLAGLWRGDLLQGLAWMSSPSTTLGLETLIKKLECQVQEGVPTWTLFNRGNVYWKHYCPSAQASLRKGFEARCRIIEACTTPKHADAFGQLSASRLVLEVPVLSLDTSSTTMPDSHFWTAVTMGSTQVVLRPDWLPGPSGALPSELLLLLMYTKIPYEDKRRSARGLIVHSAGQQGVYYRIGRWDMDFDESSPDFDEFLKDFENRKRIIELV